MPAPSFEVICPCREARGAWLNPAYNSRAVSYEGPAWMHCVVSRRVAGGIDCPAAARVHPYASVSYALMFVMRRARHCAVRSIPPSSTRTSISLPPRPNAGCRRVGSPRARLSRLGAALVWAMKLPPCCCIRRKAWCARDSAFVSERSARLRRPLGCRSRVWAVGFRYGEPAQSRAALRASIAPSTALPTCALRAGSPTTTRVRDPIGSFAAPRSGLRMSLGVASCRSLRS